MQTYRPEDLPDGKLPAESGAQLRDIGVAEVVGDLDVLGLPAPIYDAITMGHIQFGDKKFESPSEARYFVAKGMMRAGHSDERVLGVLANPDFAISVRGNGTHVTEDAAKRDITKARAEHARESPAPADEFPDDIDPKWLKPDASSSRFKAQKMSDLERLPPMQWLIEGIIPVNSLVELYGPPKAGKTFASQDMALCIATGTDFHGKKVIRGRVLCIVGEGNKGAMRDRVKAWIKTHGKHQAANVEKNWHLVGLPVTIDISETLTEFLKANAGEWDFIVVDTMLRNMAGHISDPKDMAGFVRACDRIREKTGAAVLVVHHEGKDKSKGGMGSMAMDAAVDAMLIFRRDGAKRILRVKFVRDADDNQPDMIFKLESVLLDIRDDLSDRRSAALKFITTKVKGSQLTAAEKLLKAIHELGGYPKSADLVAKLGVTRQAVSQVARELREKGYLPAEGWKLTEHGIECAISLGGEDDID